MFNFKKLKSGRCENRKTRRKTNGLIFAETEFIDKSYPVKFTPKICNYLYNLSNIYISADLSQFQKKSKNTLGFFIQYEDREFIIHKGNFLKVQNNIIKIINYDTEELTKYLIDELGNKYFFEFKDLLDLLKS